MKGTDMTSFHFKIKSGRKGTAADHAKYIARLGYHAAKEDLVFSDHGNLPSWADGNPAKLWKAADKYERANGSAYKEMIFALPNELSPMQQLPLIDEIVTQLAGPKAYQYASHAPKSSLEGEVNAHLHLMISDRMPDGNERAADKMFSRYNASNPSQGGCRKDSCGRSRMQLRDDLIAKRKLVADIQNVHLAKHGHAARVDHRTLKDQGIVRKAERHLGQAKVRLMSAEERRAYVASRVLSHKIDQTSRAPCFCNQIGCTQCNLRLM
jgi:hypothetical protein